MRAYIPTAIKQAWSADLDVLAEIDRICEKHDIKYFADWGTFLGAVRHGSPSPLVSAFVVQGKPVMLANYGI